MNIIWVIEVVACMLPDNKRRRETNNIPLEEGEEGDWAGEGPLETEEGEEGEEETEATMEGETEAGEEDEEEDEEEGEEEEESLGCLEAGPRFLLFVENEQTTLWSWQ